MDEAVLMKAVASLVDKGVESIAVCFLFSFLNPVHERRAAELIQEAYPDLYVSISSEVDPTRSEEHTSELQSLMRISYAVFCLKKKTNRTIQKIHKNLTHTEKRHNTKTQNSHTTYII